MNKYSYETHLLTLQEQEGNVDPASKLDFNIL